MKFTISDALKETEKNQPHNTLIPEATLVQFLETHWIDIRLETRNKFSTILVWGERCATLIVEKTKDTCMITDVILGDVYLNTGTRTKRLVESGIMTYF